MLTSKAFQTLRNARRVTRWVLAWFVLSLGVAIASPLINPQSTELICSGTGVMKLLVKSADGMIDDGGSETSGRMLDCPLCASVSAPPPATEQSAPTVRPLSGVLQVVHVAHIAARTAAPPPGCGPPLIS